jgi:hypothetical protein
MNKLANAGVDTKKYFNIDLPHGLKPGSTISVVINDDGQPVVVTESKRDTVAEQIITDGYVRNTKLHRRFVMAQMFNMLNYESWDGTESGYHACLNNRYTYDYTFNMMLEELKVLSKLETRDKESFEERKHFFTKGVVVNVAYDYMERLMNYIEKLPTKKCKGIPYKTIKGANVFVADLNKKIYGPLQNKIIHIKYARNYTEMHQYLQDFMNSMVRLPWSTPKSKEWIDAFKGEGAYYTLKNLIMYHNCTIEVSKRYDVGYSYDSMSYLKAALEKYKGQGWRMFALMKKVIEDNNFDFRKRMHEIYNQ